MEKKYKKMLFDIAESVSLNEDVANEYLKEKGVDVSSFVKKGIKEIKRIEFLRTAETNLSKHQELIEKAIHKIKEAIPQTIANIEIAIRKRNPAFQFRNLQELDEHQLREILEDVDLINTIEAIENKD